MQDVIQFGDTAQVRTIENRMGRTDRLMNKKEFKAAYGAEYESGKALTKAFNAYLRKNSGQASDNLFSQVRQGHLLPYSQKETSKTVWVGFLKADQIKDPEESAKSKDQQLLELLAGMSDQERSETLAALGLQMIEAHHDAAKGADTVGHAANK